VWLVFDKKNFIFISDYCIYIYLVVDKPIVGCRQSRSKLIWKRFQSTTLNQKAEEEISGWNKISYALKSI
jgi:hypothetical protein